MRQKPNDDVPGGPSLLGYAMILGVFAVISIIGVTAWEREEAPKMLLIPGSVVQGDPVMVMIEGTTTAANVKSAEVLTKSAPGDPSLHFFPYRDGIAALYGTDISQKTGAVPVKVLFKDGEAFSGSFTIKARQKTSEYLPIPDQIGGNSVANQEHVLSDLANENYQLAKIKSASAKTYWSSPFTFPIRSTVSDPRIVTDEYGSDRESGAAAITHKGVDFRAPPGTPVYAINDGLVRDAANYSIYGNTVVVDHGDGILSMYMHMNDISVKNGEAVKNGQMLGHSGETGYSEGPHLHLTIRIGGVSIDPLEFFRLMGTSN